MLPIKQRDCKACKVVTCKNRLKSAELLDPTFERVRQYLTLYRCSSLNQLQAGEPETEVSDIALFRALKQRACRCWSRSLRTGFSCCSSSCLSWFTVSLSFSSPLFLLLAAHICSLAPVLCFSQSLLIPAVFPTFLVTSPLNSFPLF